MPTELPGWKISSGNVDAVVRSVTVQGGGPYVPSIFIPAGGITGKIFDNGGVEYNIFNYGSIGATTDPGPFINQAITDANAAGGGTVRIPASPFAGDYQLATTIVPKSSVALIGPGPGSDGLSWYGANSVPMIANPPPGAGVQLTGFELRNLRLNTRNQTGVGGIFLSSWYQSLMEDVYVLNATTTGTAAVRLEASTGTDGTNATAYNNIRGLRISSCAVGLQLSGIPTGSIVAATNNYFYGLMIDDIIEKGIRFVQYCDTNTFFGTRLGGRGGTATWIGIVWNDSATPNADAGVYNESFHGLAIDNPTGLAGQDALRFNFTAGNAIRQLWTSIGPGGSPGNLINDTNGGANSKSHYVELMSASVAFGSTRSTVYQKGYSHQSSRQVVAFTTPYTPDPTLGEIIEFGVLTASIGVNAPVAATLLGTGQRMTFRFTQNGAGGWVVAWNAVFKTLWQPSPQANAISEITFYYDGTNWQQLSANLVDNLGRLYTPGEIVNGSFILAGSSVNAGTALVAATRTLTGKGALAYSASITPDASAFNWQLITVTNGTAFTINAPTSPPSAAQSEELTIEVLNSSGGAMGVITWNAAFIFAGITWANPASTKKRSVRFEWSGTAWIALSFTTADY